MSESGGPATGPVVAVPPPSADLLDLTAELVSIPSVSFDERAIADHLEGELRRCDHLRVERLGDNLIARTDLGRGLRLVLAGHTDTVPPAGNGNEIARVDGDTLWGLGSADMKGGLAVFLDLARTVGEPAVDLTFVFYVAEEVAAEHNGLRALFGDAPHLVAGDAAILGEPTSAVIEAGCQGSLRVDVVIEGRRAHTARPWMGANAIHRAAPLLDRLARYEARRPVLDGCEYREALQAVRIEGGVAGNVVPDRLVVALNHRFAPDRSPTEAEAHVRDVIDSAGIEGEVAVEVGDLAPAAAPHLRHPLLAALVGRNQLEVRAKLGWTDVARFSAAGVPAVNFGPGDATLAHTPDERVERHQLEAARAALADLVVNGPG